MANFTIRELGKALADSGIVSKAGATRLRQALAAAAEEKAGVRPSNPMVRVSLDKGEYIPRFLEGTPGVDGRAGELAAADWSRSWINVSVWTREWHNNKADTFGFLKGDSDSLRADIAAISFSPEELEILAEAGVSIETLRAALHSGDGDYRPDDKGGKKR